MSVQTAGISVAIPVRESIAAQTSSRLGLLDLSRLIAAAGIVWVHVTATETGDNLFPALYPLGTFGVPFYLFIAILFMARAITREPKMPLTKYILSRIVRVYVPFLAWTLVYSALTEVKFYSQHHTLDSVPLSVLYAGGHMHLWFLSYLMIISILGAILVRGLMDKKQLRYAIAGSFSNHRHRLLLLAGAGVDHQSGESDRRYGVLEVRLPCAAYHILVDRISTHRRREWETSPAQRLKSRSAGSCSGSVRCWRWIFSNRLSFSARWPASGWRYLHSGRCGRGLLKKSDRWGNTATGVYLSHVMFVRIFILWMQRYDMQPSVSFLVLEFVIVFACSLGLSILLSQSKYTRWVLGE